MNLLLALTPTCLQNGKKHIAQPNSFLGNLGWGTGGQSLPLRMRCCRWVEPYSIFLLWINSQCGARSFFSYMFSPRAWHWANWRRWMLQSWKRREGEQWNHLWICFGRCYFFLKHCELGFQLCTHQAGDACPRPRPQPTHQTGPRENTLSQIWGVWGGI